MQADTHTKCVSAFYFGDPHSLVPPLRPLEITVWEHKFLSYNLDKSISYRPSTQMRAHAFFQSLPPMIAVGDLEIEV